jgi:hypothetical protein
MTITSKMVPYVKSYDYGIGAHLATGSPMNKVVDGVVSGVQDAMGAAKEFEIQQITSTSALESALGIDAEASYGIGAFGSVNARFNFAKRAKIQNSSLFLAIIATVKLEYRSIDEPTLTSAAREIFGNSELFATRYGTMFVRGIDRGGLFIGLISIDTSSAEEAQTISGKLSGAYGLFSAEAKMKLQQLEQQYQSAISIMVYHEGGPVDLHMDDIQNPMQLYDIFTEWLKAFQVDPERNAMPYNVQLAPIAIANGPIPPNMADLQEAQDVLVICAKERSAKLDGLNLMNYIIENPARYNFPAPTTLNDIVKASNGYQADLDLVAAAASQAINDPAKAVFPAVYAEKEGKTYPQGIPPTPMPTLKQGLIPMPQFVGKTYEDGIALAEQFGLSLEDNTGFGDPDIPLSHLIEPIPGHPDWVGSQVVIYWQRPDPGTPVSADTPVAIAYHPQ